MGSVNFWQVEKDLTDHLAANLPAGIVAARVSYPNAPFITPNNLPWLRATITAPEVIDRDASGCYREYLGVFVVDVFYPKSKGSKAATEMADAIAESFNSKAFAYSYCPEADVQVIGQEDFWYHVQINAIYQYGSILEE